MDVDWAVSHVLQPIPRFFVFATNDSLLSEESSEELEAFYWTKTGLLRVTFMSERFVLRILLRILLSF